MRWIEDFCVWLLEKRGMLAKHKCMAYGGGDVCKGTVRVCKKWRYHTDSHVYGYWLRDDEGELDL